MRAEAHFDGKVGGIITAGAAPGPIEAWHLLDRAALRHFEPSTGLGIVESERLAVAHDLLTADEHMPYRPLAGGIDETADRIVKRLHRRVGVIDHHEAGFG